MAVIKGRSASVFLWHENNASRGTAEGFIRIQPSSALCMCRDTRRCNRCIRRYGHGYGCPWEAVKRAAGSTLNHADHDKVLSTGEAPVTERAGTYKIGSRAHPHRITQNHLGPFALTILGYATFLSATHPGWCHCAPHRHPASLLLWQQQIHSRLISS